MMQLELGLEFTTTSKDSQIPTALHPVEYASIVYSSARSIVDRDKI
jgi:hypothetical protein